MKKLLMLLAAAVITASANAAVVVTTAIDGPHTPSTTTDEVAFAADVSNSDLLHGVAGVHAGWKNANGAQDIYLNDGNPGGDYDAIGISALIGAAWAKDGDNVSSSEFFLGVGNGAGYDLTEIQSIAAWQGAGFSNQKYDVSVRYLGAAVFTALLKVDYQPFTTDTTEGGSTKVNVTDDAGVLVGGIEAIKFSILDTASKGAGGAVFREIDVTGAPTAVSSIGIVVETNDSTVIYEKNTETDTFSVVLNSQPTADVIVTADPNHAAYASSDFYLNNAQPYEAVTLTFSTSNWNIPQVITVTPVDDLIEEDIAEHGVVLFSTTSIDSNFNGKLIGPCVMIDIIDNDTLVVKITESNNDTEVAEGGVGGHPESDTFTLELNKAPTSDVTITLYEADVDPNDLIISPRVLTFTPANWNVPVEVAVTAINDDFLEVEIQAVDFAVVSDDQNYHELVVDSLQVAILANECGVDPFNSADINEDCSVDLNDFVILASQWMTCTFPNIVGCQ